MPELTKELNIEPSENDLAVTYYVTGYCCRSLVRPYKCSKCKEATVADINCQCDDLIPCKTNLMPNKVHLRYYEKILRQNKQFLSTYSSLSMSRPKKINK